MDTIGALLLIFSVIALIIGLIQPTVFPRLFKGNKPTRKKLSLIFGGLIIVSFAILGSSPQTNENAKTAVRTQPANITATTKSAPTTTNTSDDATQAATKPSLRQDLAFSGDASFCDATYRANDNGTTTWTLNIKQAGEIITHLSDKSGHIYRHDDKVGVGYDAYTADVNINDVSEINGVLYIGNDSHPCNVAPAS